MTPDAAQMWMKRQPWIRDRDKPCLSLGERGDFDDMHMFAPCVAFEDGLFRMWYCGATGDVAGRVFKVGLATSADGVHFSRHSSSPVLSFADDRRSVLTATLLRSPAGSVLREGGELRMWFSACDFPSGNGLHTLHQSSSTAGVAWSIPSEPLLEHVYAPTVIREPDSYRMWYIDVQAEPWSVRHATSTDCSNWQVSDDPVLEVDEDWEHQRLFYPTVLRCDGLYLMWYGSYSAHAPDEMKTALGFAVSEDGLKWQKHPENPVFGPEPSNDWESHYTTSQSVIKLPDGSWRIWYAARQKPPFVHKYFAIGTARMAGPR